MSSDLPADALRLWSEVFPIGPPRAEQALFRGGFSEKRRRVYTFRHASSANAAAHHAPQAAPCSALKLPADSTPKPGVISLIHAIRRDCRAWLPRRPAPPFLSLRMGTLLLLATACLWLAGCAFLRHPC